MRDDNFKIKVLATDTDNYVTKGKIYEFKDGKTIWDTGCKSSYYSNFEILKADCNKWLIVEKVSDEVKENYYKLYSSPIIGIGLNGYNKENFLQNLNRNQSIIFTKEQETFTYDKIPEVIIWLQKVYNYCTKIENKTFDCLK